jgi:hypothetical protein
MIWALFHIIALSCGPLALLAQETRREEVFTGYSYLRASDSLSQRVNQNGWDFSVAANFSKSFSLVADISNHYGTTGGAFDPTTGAFNPIGTGGKGFSFLFGPRGSYRGIPKLTPFARVRFGGMRGSKLVPNLVGGPEFRSLIVAPLCGFPTCAVSATSLRWPSAAGWM